MVDLWWIDGLIHGHFDGKHDDDHGTLCGIFMDKSFVFLGIQPAINRTYSGKYEPRI